MPWCVPSALMSLQKTVIGEADVRRFLCRHLGLETVAVQGLSGGESSAAFAFVADGRPLVIRVNKHGAEGFLKDRFAYEAFGSVAVPVPEVLEVGEIDQDTAFAISERAPGQCLQTLSPGEMDLMLPALVQVMDAIHGLAPPGEGYGPWTLSGDAEHRSWREFVLTEVRRDAEGDDGEGRDQRLHKVLCEKVTQLARDLPEERRLVHGDLGYGNAAGDADGITGVFDWECSMYGDPLFDVAWLDFWATGRDYAGVVRRHYETARGQVPSGFDTRVQAYRLVIGLKSLRFFAWSGQPEKYEFARERVTATGLRP
jgi:hygromycin-B 4-O-kinase